ncbi:MAG: STAS domain-containing protein [Haliscomenobacter sp.]
MKFAIDKQEKYTIFQVQEDNLNSLIAPNLKSEIVLLFNEGIKNLIIDLSQVAYVDSSGLSAILTADRLWKDQGSFVLTGLVHPAVKKLIEISRLDSVLVIVPTVEESIDYVFMEEVARELDATEHETE